MNYTQAQIDRANAVSLEDFLRTQGETLIKSGREYRWKEHDSLTVRGNKWFRHSQSKGGYPIDFVMEFYGKSFPEAVQLLTGESGEGQSEASTAPPTAFHLPLHNRTADRAIQYLCESRGLNKTLVEAFLLSGDIYEDAKRHNVVFVGRDRSGTPRYAHVRGTADPFRQDIAGSDKSYPFRYEGNGNQLFVFEAPIDLLSFICLYPQDWQTRNYLALGGVSGKALDRFLSERKDTRKNETYENMNVIVERIPFNVHFKKTTAPTYMEQLKQMETDGQVSLRGLRKDATLFDEIVIDVNTMYFERNGGYEYAKQFYEEAYHFIEEKFGADNVISAVMHADEINIAASEELGKEVYHYHLHAMVLPVVEKEILWSKRCKDPELRGTVKEVVNQISHSKKWKSDIPMTDEKGNPLLKKNGKPMFRASYSILQDELFNYMTERGFKGFQRGEYGSTAEHLTSLQYQIQQESSCPCVPLCDRRNF